MEIALARSLRLADGMTLDYTIVAVDCKFSHRMGGWMIRPKAEQQADAAASRPAMGTAPGRPGCRAAEANLRPASNRDGKRAVSERSQAAVLAARPRPVPETR